MSSVTDNLNEIYTHINDCAKAAQRDPAGVNLVAVSKKQSAERIQAALNAGHRLFGENRVQEAQEHWQAIKQSGDYPDLKLHLIGPLQTNKVKEAVELFDVIETVDRPKLAHALRKEMDKQGRELPCFVQVNTGEEPQKAGILPHELIDFLALCREDCKLDIKGLMCIPPVDEPPAVHFAFLQKLAIAQGLTDLSMGMSADYQKAIPLGATYVRVGTAIFGDRQIAA